MIDPRHCSLSRDIIFLSAQEKLLFEPLKTMDFMNHHAFASETIPESVQDHYRHSAVRKQKRKQLVVRFQEENTTFIPPLLSELTLDQAEKLWYQRSDIAAFKCHVQKLLLQGRNQYDHQEDRSGLERFNLDRSLHKKRTNHCVVQAWKKRKVLSHATTIGSPEIVSQIYRNHSAVSTELALEQGLEDFCQVYDPFESLLGGDAHDDMSITSNNNERQNYNNYFFSDSADESRIIPPINPVATQSKLSFSFPFHKISALIETTPTTTISIYDKLLTADERLRMIREKQAMVSLQIAANFQSMGCINNC
jgi:hypothetical protein